MKSFRGGAIDVVLKEPEVVPYLRERVLDAATELRSTVERTALLEEMAESHEDFLRKMREMSKTITDMEDRILGRSKTGERAAISSDPVDVVVVDDDPEAVPRFQRVLPEDQGWRFFAAFTGGEALDHVTQQRPHIVIVKEHLPDLPGTMVVKSVKSGAPDAITLLYTPPVRGGQAGVVKMLEGSRVINLVPSYSTPEQLVGGHERDPRGAAPESEGAPLPAGLPAAQLRVLAALQLDQAARGRAAGAEQEDVSAALRRLRPAPLPTSSTPIYGRFR